MKLRIATFIMENLDDKEGDRTSEARRKHRRDEAPDQEDRADVLYLQAVDGP